MESLSIEELFGSLKKVASETDIKRDETNSSNGTGQEEFQKDVLEFEEDAKLSKSQETFKQIEQQLRKLPTLETDFDQLAKASKTGIEPQMSKIDDPITILQSRKHDKKTKEPSEAEKWFTLPKQELTSEMKRDLLLIKHRAALDPKRHYKKDKWKVPERFSVGTIVEDKSEFFSSRINNKQRKNTILESLMVDDDTNKYFKRKYSEVQRQKTSGKKAHYKKVKENRNKF